MFICRLLSSGDSIVVVRGANCPLVAVLFPCQIGLTFVAVHLKLVLGNDYRPVDTVGRMCGRRQNDTVLVPSKLT